MPGEPKPRKKKTNPITRGEERSRPATGDSLNAYIREISRFKPLSPEHEKDLGRRIRKGDQEALQRLVEANLRFVVSYAKRYRGLGLSFMDLIHEGTLGLMEAATSRTVAHVTATRLEHLDTRLADLPTIRAYLARMRIATDQARALLADTLAAMEAGRQDATLRVLEVKAAAAEAATAVTDLAMRVCGGAAFRKEAGVERQLRDARAATVMAPTTDALYDFVGRALCGIDLFA